MFESRLRIFMLLPLLCSGALLARLYQIQVIHGERYEREADEALVRPIEFLPPLRGKILDRFGRVLVSDEPTYDVTVPYGVLSESPEHVAELARWLRRNDPAWSVPESGGPRSVVGEGIRAVRDVWKKVTGVEQPSKSALKSRSVAETEAEVRRRVAEFWKTLSGIAGLSRDELDNRRRSIRDSVERIRRVVWNKRRERGDDQPLEAVPLREEKWHHAILRDVTPAVRTQVELASVGLPVVRIEPSVRRVWQDGAVSLCHVLGRLGQVTEDTIRDDPRGEDWLTQYRAGDEVGLTGVEQLGEELLRGKRGFVERYRDGRINQHQPPIDGLDVQMTIDLELQNRVAEILRAAVQQNPPSTGASAVVLDIQSREVLAMVSIPDYDPRTLGANFPALRDDAAGLPLLFRAVRAEYPPGSTIKPVSLLAALSQGVLQTAEEVFCDGSLIPGAATWHCWTHWRGLAGHGYLAAEEAIQHSCNIYFYTLGQRVGGNRLAAFYRKFLRGQLDASDPPQGAALVDEMHGLIPTETWMRNRHGHGFQPGDGRNFAIGQGELRITPLQAANMFATLAAGEFRAPTILANDGRDRPVLAFPEIPPLDWEITRRGLFRCVNEPEGTAYKFARLDHLEICGKTGSAQCVARVTRRRYTFETAAADGSVQRRAADAPSIESARMALGLPTGAACVEKKIVDRWPPPDPQTGKLPTHAWFTGFAPYQSPRIAIAVMLEYGGGGGQVAGPPAREIFQALMDSPQGYF